MAGMVVMAAVFGWCPRLDSLPWPIFEPDDTFVPNRENRVRDGKCAVLQAPPWRFMCP